MIKYSKKIQKVLIMALLIFPVVHLYPQEKKTAEIKIKTSAVCGMCKDRIEKGMAFEKGVKDVTLDLETKVATIQYNTKATTPEELRLKISKLGYDADSVMADKKAYDKLPACCRKDAPPH